ncbi:MAG TPA: alcohol dehydrogenase catalytic domain-containing protein [Anaerolineaceae bacterium]|nr:alcohol dehydrogenase catalytic domain-containing protein [Anaerolineaceae bacterium]
MKTLVWHKAVDVRLEERPIPQPGPGELLIRIRALGICGSDLKLYKYGILGTLQPTHPFIMGHEGAGQVSEIGVNVEGFKLGDPVIINPQAACGDCFYCRKSEQNLCERLNFKSVTTDGVFSEFVLVRADQAIHLPNGFDFGLATTVEPVSVALQAIRSTKITASDSVLLFGAGSIGLAVLSILCSVGVSKVAMVDPQEYALERARKLGATITLNPQKDELARKISESFGTRGPDIVIEASGSSSAQSMVFEFARPGGVIILTGITAEATANVNVNRLVRSNLRVFGSVRTSGDTFQTAAQLVTSGRVDTRTWISQVFPFEQAPQAFAYTSDQSHQVTKCLLKFPDFHI